MYPEITCNDAETVPPEEHFVVRMLTPDGRRVAGVWRNGVYWAYGEEEHPVFWQELETTSVGLAE